MIWLSLYAFYMFQIKPNRNIKNRRLRQYYYRYSLQPLIYDVLHTEGDFYLGNADSEREKRSQKNKDGKNFHRIIY